MNTKPNNPAWISFLKECQADRRIQIITETFDRPAVLGLINACDAYVSLHRAEGFGRTIAEAMLLGKPVVVTRYSGNVDFVMLHGNFPVNFTLKSLSAESYQWVDAESDCRWADVDTADAMRQFRNALKFPKNREISQMIAESAQALLGVKAVEKKFSNALTAA